MKKFFLFVLIAVIASRALKERDDRHPRPHPHPSPVSDWFRSLAGDDDEPATLEAPTPPAPPRPHGPRSRVVRVARDEVKVTRSDFDAPNAPATPDAPATPKGSTPDWFPTTIEAEEAAAVPDDAGVRVLVGQLSVSEDRARADLRKSLNEQVTQWLAADVPTTWVPPSRLVDRMILSGHVRKVARTLDLQPAGAGLDADAKKPGSSGDRDSLGDLNKLYTFYQAGQKLDFSPTRHAGFVKEYRRDVAKVRMRTLGGGLALTLVGLAVVSGYIRADQATRGYYTNRLRLLATLGLGAAGYAAYRFYA